MFGEVIEFTLDAFERVGIDFSLGRDRINNGLERFGFGLESVFFVKKRKAGFRPFGDVDRKDGRAGVERRGIYLMTLSISKATALRSGPDPR